MDQLDAHARPPEYLRTIYKRYQKTNVQTMERDEGVFDLTSGHTAGFEDARRVAKTILDLPNDIQHVLLRFLRAHEDQSSVDGDLSNAILSSSQLIYEHPDVPGLYIFPSLLPPSVQIRLLSLLFHRDLSNPAHKTNIHTHYKVPHPASGQSYFSPSSTCLDFQPHDESIHRPLSTTQFLSRKLRWMTLGGQYDWTTKSYPSTSSPSHHGPERPVFPEDIADLIEGLFPAIRPEAAIVNLYSPGDTLSLHRDVSEEAERPLVSVSLGCEGIFVVGRGDGDQTDGTENVNGKGAAVVRVKSGDAVVMAGQARRAWHGVPMVLRETCPDWMAEWPCLDGSDRQGMNNEGDGQCEEYKAWKGWMAGKRINLNVRQMFD